MLNLIPNKLINGGVMKTSRNVVLAAAFFLFSVSTVHSQGTVNFANKITGLLDAPVYDVDGVTKLDDRYFVQLYAGPTAESLLPIGMARPFRTGTGVGYIDHTSAEPGRTIPTVRPGNTAVIQVRAWSMAYGVAFEEAYAKGGAIGMSPVFEVVTGGAGIPPTIPANLVGLQSFSLWLPARFVVTSETTHLTSKGFTFQVGGQAGKVYEIEATTDLVHWETLAAVTNLNGTVEYLDASAATLTNRFYRVKQP